MERTQLGKAFWVLYMLRFCGWRLWPLCPLYVAASPIAPIRTTQFYNEGQTGKIQYYIIFIHEVKCVVNIYIKWHWINFYLFWFEKWIQHFHPHSTYRKIASTNHCEYLNDCVEALSYFTIPWMHCNIFVYCVKWTQSIELGGKKRRQLWEEWRAWGERNVVANNQNQGWWWCYTKASSPNMFRINYFRKS